MEDNAILARAMLQSSFSGVLSTHSLEYPGFPFGSVVPYCLNAQGLPLILISRLAQHTKNIKANTKVSLTLVETGPANVQLSERMTLMAEAVPIQDPKQIGESAQRYYGYFPQALGYHDQLDFEFFTLQPVKARFIAGFGRAHWIGIDRLLMANAFTWEQEHSIISHMNSDHVSALQHYCDLNDIPHQGESVLMCGLDSEGMVLRIAETLKRLPFRESVVNTEQVRKALVAMAREPLPMLEND